MSDYDVVVRQIVVHSDLVLGEDRRLLVPTGAPLNQVTIPDGVKRDELPLRQPRIEDEMGDHFVFVFANNQVFQHKCDLAPILDLYVKPDVLIGFEVLDLPGQNLAWICRVFDYSEDNQFAGAVLIERTELCFFDDLV